MESALMVAPARSPVSRHTSDKMNVASSEGVVSGSSVRQGDIDESLGVRLEHGPVVPAARILVIEDNGSDVFLLERALKKQSFRFEMLHLADGGAALAFIRRQGIYSTAAVPNLILMDLNLAKYSGEDILRAIRASDHLAGIPICVWSSSKSRRDRSVLADLGIARFITKPTGLDQFMQIGIIIRDLVAGPDAGR